MYVLNVLSISPLASLFFWKENRNGCRSDDAPKPRSLLLPEPAGERYHTHGVNWQPAVDSRIFNLCFYSTADLVTAEVYTAQTIQNEDQ